MLSEKFVELLGKKLSGEISMEEAIEFNDLLANCEECKKQYALFRQYWVQDKEEYLNSNQMFQRISTRIQVPEAETEIEQTRKAFKYWRVVAAVFLIGITVLCTYIYQNQSMFSKAQSALKLTQVPSRSKGKLVLSDGTKVTLNAESVLKYPLEFNGNTREVYLSGEAYFEVTKDHRHPFIVHAGKMNVRVLGTEFNVKSYANDPASSTTLIKGLVEITLADRPADRIILKPHDKLILQNTVNKETSNPHRLAAVSPQKEHTSYALTDFTYFKSTDSTIVETSWVNDRLTFKNESFGDLANQMERWYGVKFVFKNNRVKKYHFTGEFDKESCKEALGALQMTESFDYKVDNSLIYIY